MCLQCTLGRKAEGAFFDLIITVIFSDISFFQLFWEFFFVGVIIVDILILSFTGIVSNLSFGI